MFFKMRTVLPLCDPDMQLSVQDNVLSDETSGEDYLKAPLQVWTTETTALAGLFSPASNIIG